MYCLILYIVISPVDYGDVWSCGLCIYVGGGEGGRERRRVGRRWGGPREKVEIQLFVLNGKNVLVNVYQNVNYFVLLQSKRRSNRILLILMCFFV